jgi:hypothetical protein
MWEKYPNKEFTFVEVDLPIVVSRKIKKLEQSKKIKELLGEITIKNNRYEAKHQ